MRMTLRFGTVWLLVGVIGTFEACGDDDASSPGDAGPVCPAVGRPDDGTACTHPGALCYYRDGNLVFTCLSGPCPGAPCDALLTECSVRGFGHWDTGGCIVDDAGSEDASVIFNAPNNRFPCLDPTPIEGDRPGLVLCANGMKVSPAPPDCGPSPQPASDQCQVASDCPDGACYCAGTPGFTVNSCVSRRDGSDCVSDIDCVSGFHCVLYSAGFGSYVGTRQRCQQPIDECAVEADCAAAEPDAGPSNGPLCQHDSQGRVCCDPANDWECASRIRDAGVGGGVCPAVGRPADGTACRHAGALCFYDGERTGRLVFTCISGNCPDAPCNALFTQCGGSTFHHIDSVNCEGGI